MQVLAVVITIIYPPLPKKPSLPGSSVGKGKGVLETPEGRVCRVYSSTPGNIGPGGVRGLPQAQGWLCGWSW